ncbi:MAG: arsenosugar biosynthesis radical SAM protein ArsS [Planctomycetes bacterium]|nr:arsenosugar biosynthesis radical SAM protein ArsS [Planctomycetota bacterium]
MASSLEDASQGLKVVPTLARRGAELASPRVQLEALARAQLADPLGGDFDRHVERAGFAPLSSVGIQVLQLNLGRVCNQTCAHCHVDAGPDRRESMSRETAELALRFLERTSIPTVDLTGGAPELNPNFEHLVRESRRLGRHVLDRCNLTILGAPRYAHLPRFFAEHRVEVICSLPHYRQLSTDRQRGEGVYAASIEGLKLLNAVGYGREGSGLRLVLVTNPVGAFLPAGQRSLEAEWKRELRRLHGIEFDALYTITNMPISRFLEWLLEKGELEAYLEKLVGAFNPAAASGVMCRTTLSVGWDGRLFDCDFNQMLDLELGFGAPRHLADVDLRELEQVGRVDALERRRIVTARHCFGCTAGAGSSCGGALA